MADQTANPTADPINFTDPPILQSDLNGDGCVDGADEDIFKTAFGCMAGDECYNESCDFDHDGVVSVRDFVVFKRQFGQGVCPPGGPE